MSSTAVAATRVDANERSPLLTPAERGSSVPPISGPAPVANSLGVATVSVHASAAVQAQSDYDLSNIDLRLAYPAGQAGAAAAGADLSARHIKQYRRLPETEPQPTEFDIWSPTAVGSWTAEKVVAVARIIAYLFKYYVMTWGLDAELVNVIISRVDESDFQLDLCEDKMEGGPTNWIQQFQEINQNRDMIAYYLGDKAKRFLAFLDLIQARMIGEDGTVKDLEFNRFNKEVLVLNEIISQPRTINFSYLEGRADLRGAGDKETAELNIARAVRDGFQLLETTLSFPELVRFKQELVYRTLLLMKHEEEHGIQGFPRTDALIEELKGSLAMSEAELLEAVKDKFDSIKSSIGAYDANQLKAALEARIAEAELSCVAFEASAAAAVTSSLTAIVAVKKAMPVAAALPAQVEGAAASDASSHGDAVVVEVR